ncbi:MAG TPA: SDR family oxidoreductase [Steroidobacteraceae bacterium]|nr:SDR family oxidoreductase [Steroidobacteraceae bacterium]
MRSVIVTGGSRGLGLVIARVVSAAGFRVIAIARSATDELSQAAQTAARTGAGAIEFRAFDLSEIATIPGFVRELRSEFGAIYGLVNNAAIGTPGILGVMPDPDIERLVSLNTLAPIILTKYVVRSMMVNRDGRIINISSIVASTGYNALSVYSATKGSLISFTRSLAREVGKLGITVNAVAPGFMDTEMTKEMDDGARRKIVGRIALRRLAEPIDVARTVEFLLNESGRNITGTVLTVDAGTTA